MTPWLWGIILVATPVRAQTEWLAASYAPDAVTRTAQGGPAPAARAQTEAMARATSALPGPPHTQTPQVIAQQPSRRPARRSGRAPGETIRKDSSRYGEPIKLPPRADASGGPADNRSSTAGGGVVSVVFSSLAIVIGLFLLVVWFARRALPKSATALPGDVLELLGRSSLGSRHHLQLIRLGRRLLLVSVTQDSAETLAEITDADEVNHLAGLCRQEQSNSVTGSFRQVLHQLGTQPAARSRRSRRAERVATGSEDTPGVPTALRTMRELS